MATCRAASRHSSSRGSGWASSVLGATTEVAIVNVTLTTPLSRTTHVATFDAVVMDWPGALVPTVITTSN